MTIQLPPPDKLVRLTVEELDFGEMDDFADMTGYDPVDAKAQVFRKTMRAIAVLGLRRQGQDVTWDDMAKVKLNEVVDLDWYKEQGAAAADPTVAGA